MIFFNSFGALIEGKQNNLGAIFFPLIIIIQTLKNQKNGAEKKEFLLILFFLIDLRNF